MLTCVYSTVLKEATPIQFYFPSTKLTYSIRHKIFIYKSHIFYAQL